MCDYTKVEYACGHNRYTVRSWCTTYSNTHKRCPVNVVAVEYRLEDKCGDCKHTPSSLYLNKPGPPPPDKKDESTQTSEPSFKTPEIPRR